MHSSPHGGGGGSQTSSQADCSLPRALPLSLAPHICQSSQLLSPSPPTSSFCHQQSVPSQPNALALTPTTPRPHLPLPAWPFLTRSPLAPPGADPSSCSFSSQFSGHSSLKHICLHCLVLGNHLWFKKISKKRASELKKNAHQCSKS